MNIPTTTVTRFFSKVVRDQECVSDKVVTPCWTWQQYQNAKGYGHFKCRVEGKVCTFYSHRFSFLLAHGPIPRGWQVDHVCENPCCVNPGHLRAVPDHENPRSRYAKRTRPESTPLDIRPYSFALVYEVADSRIFLGTTEPPF